MEILKPFQYKPLPSSPGSLDKVTLLLHQRNDFDSYTTDYYLMGERITSNVIYVRTPLCLQSTHTNHNLPRTFQRLSLLMPPDYPYEPSDPSAGHCLCSLLLSSIYL